MNESLADRKKRFLEDCCGGGGMSTPPMTGGDNMYTSDANPMGPTAGYDKLLGKKKKSPVAMAKRLRREGYKPLDDRKIDRMNDAAYKQDEKYRKETGRDKFSAKGEKISQEIERFRDNPKGHRRDADDAAAENRRRARSR